MVVIRFQFDDDSMVAITRLPGPFLSVSFSSRDSILAAQLNSVVNERASRLRLVSFTASCKHSHSYTTFYKPSHPYTASYNSGWSDNMLHRRMLKKRTCSEHSVRHATSITSSVEEPPQWQFRCPEFSVRKTVLAPVLPFCRRINAANRPKLSNLTITICL